MAAEQSAPAIFVAGIYAADLVFTGDRMPDPGETIFASGFMRSHGGKGSNQAVAAARAGGKVSFFSLIGDDAFGADAAAFWQAEGVRDLARRVPGATTGAAGIFVNAQTGNNAIAVYPGASAGMTAEDLEQVSDDIAQARVFVVQLEQPVAAALRGLQIAKANGVLTILNPAPAAALPEEIFPLCDYLVPNESEAAMLSGQAVQNVDQARDAAQVLRKKGAERVIITLGEAGALYCGPDGTFQMPALKLGPCVDTTGAGDGFTAGLAVALSQGKSAKEAIRYASALAGISVTRHGAAASMPSAEEIEQALERSESDVSINVLS